MPLWSVSRRQERLSAETTPAKSVTSVLRNRSSTTLVKVAMVGDSQVGKTSLMERFCEATFDETQLHTQGVNFMERSVTLSGQDVTFSIWDIGGHTDSESMLPLVCNDAAALLLLFDLTRPETLDAIRDWHRKARALNKCAMPFLVGCKYDLLLEQPVEEQLHMVSIARRFAAAVDAPLIFCAPSVPINVSNVFKVILIRLFGLAPAVPLLSQPGEPVLHYEMPQPASCEDSTVSSAGQRTQFASSARGSANGPPPRNDSYGDVSVGGGTSAAFGV